MRFDGTLLQKPGSKNLPKAFWFGAFKQLIICLPKQSVLHFYSNYNILQQVSILWFEMLCKFSLLPGITINTLKRIFKIENPFFHSKIVRKSLDISATCWPHYSPIKHLSNLSVCYKSIPWNSIASYTDHTTPKWYSSLNYLLIGTIYVPIIYDSLQPKKRLRSCHQIWNSFNLTPKCPVLQVSPPKEIISPISIYFD